MPDLDIVTALGLGFLLGVRHAFDADHVAAVSTILSQRPRLRASGLVGIYWGFGHTATLLVVGLLAVLLHITIPPPIAEAFEFVVGAMLVVLGASLAWSLYREQWHLHAHDHESGRHVHLHHHDGDQDHDHEHWTRWSVRPLIVGMVHGLAGSAALLLVVMASVETVGGALLYIAVFGIGSIAGMAVIGLMIGLPLVFSASLGRQVQVWVRSLASLSSIALGVAMMVRIV